MRKRFPITSPNREMYFDWPRMALKSINIIAKNRNLDNSRITPFLLLYPETKTLSSKL